MKSSTITIIIVILLVIAGVYLFVNKDKYFGPKEENINNQTIGPQTYNVKIKDLAFTPAELNIKLGDTVVWTNEDTAKYLVISDRFAEISSKLLSNGNTYSHTFNKVGEFPYHCELHYNAMKGKVIVSSSTNLTL